MNRSPTPSTTRSVSNTGENTCCNRENKLQTRFIYIIIIIIILMKVCLSVNNTEVNLVPADMREPVFEFIRPPVYHPPQVKFPHRQPLRYLDRYRDGKEHTYGIYWERTTHITMQMCGCLPYLCEIIKRFSTVLGFHFLIFSFLFFTWNHIFSPTRTFIVSFEWFCFDTKHNWGWTYLGGCWGDAKALRCKFNYPH